MKIARDPESIPITVIPAVCGGNPGCLFIRMDPRRLLAGMTEVNGHFRQVLSGIQAAFYSDGSPPETAGMTTTRGIPATNCGYDRRGDGSLLPTGGDDDRCVLGLDYMLNLSDSDRYLMS